MDPPSPTKPSAFQVSTSGSTAVVSSPLRKMIAVAAIAAGIQFGWALQLSLLTPYVQLLGVPHTWSSFIWLCGPISGLVVQPIVGYYSDRSTSRFGRRRPFILSGAIAVAIAVFLIGYAADMGHSFGDDITKKTRPRAVAIFVVGFWILDVANNMLQGPCRAFLADLAAGDHRKTRTSFGFFSFFMAVGNVLGYAAGSYSNLHKIFPFTETAACDVFCANLKTCFFFSIILLLVLTIFALVYVEDPQYTADSLEMDDGPSCFGELTGAFKELKKPMWLLMLVTALNWIAWFPYFLFDTDWMGREVYGGDVGEKAYDAGVREGSLGLMINAVVLGLMSLAIEPLGRVLGGVKNLWGICNYILAIGLAMTVVITKAAEHERKTGAVPVGAPSMGVKAGAMAFFAVLGIPNAGYSRGLFRMGSRSRGIFLRGDGDRDKSLFEITYSVPFALASIYSADSGAGQGLSLGVLNLAIVVPQMVVSAVSGPWDALFGGGNLPAFVAGAVLAAVSATLAIILLPKTKASDMAKANLTGSFH